MKKYTLSIIAIFVAISAFGQWTTYEERRDMRKNLTIKEWNTEGKRKWLDRMTVYNAEGYKIEEIEYAAYGQRWRITTEHDESGKVKQEIEYDHKNKPFRIRRYEYNAEGRRIKQYNYLPSGKLYSTKEIEYTVKK